MSLPNKLYINKFMIRSGMLHPAEFPPDNPEEEYIRKGAIRALITAQIRRENLNFAALGGGGQTFCINTLEWVLKQLDTIGEKSEKPTNIDFEQELYKHFGQVKDFTLGMQIGKYFYELGCRRTAEKYDEIEYKRQRAEESVPNDIESYAQKVEDYYDVGEERGYLCVHRGEVKDAVIAGAKWQKEQMMMKEAVEWDYTLEDGRIEFEGDPLPCLNPILNLPFPKFKPGQKVKLIIVKEEE